MASHSSVPAWRIPWTEEPGGLQSMGVTQSQTRLKRLSLHAVCARHCALFRRHKESQSSGLFRLESQGLWQEL